jgi:RNA polymerase sigma-70 factor (ECF subfamily)
MREDAQIVEGCIMKKQQCFALLYERYASPLYATALRYTKSEADAKDVLHDAFFNILDNITQFEGRGTLLAWLTRIVVNQALEWHRLQRRGLFVNFDDYEETIADESIVDSDKLTHKVLLEFIRELAPGQQAVFNLCEIEGYSYKEAAKELNCNELNCRTQLFKAKSILKKRVNDFLENENR